MDIEYYLKSRTAFIRYFYENAVRPFSEIRTAIENEEEPFIPPYSEDAEPAFLEEWMEADTSIETIGHACISMLSSSLYLFMDAWVSRWKREYEMSFDVNFKKKGWFNGYKEIFHELELPLTNCGADLDVIEQTILARNRVQHPEELTMLRVAHSEKDLERFPNPFFAKEAELKMVNIADDGNIIWWLKPSVTTTKEKVFEAVKQVETLCSWLEAEYWKTRNA
jgi:hypothetical protein